MEDSDVKAPELDIATNSNEGLVENNWTKYKNLRSYLTIDHVFSECRIKNNFWFLKSKVFVAPEGGNRRFDFRLSQLKQRDLNDSDFNDFKNFKNKELINFIERLNEGKRINPKIFKNNALHLNSNFSNVLHRLKKRVEETFATDDN